MKSSTWFGIKKVAVSVLALLIGTHHFILRPWFLNWGAPEKIQSASLPGDHFTSDKGHTRAVLIEATPGEIWPWIVQLGQDRGGMYSYSWVENLVGADIHNVYQIKKELQIPRAQGDTIWLANKNRYNGQGFQILVMVLPNVGIVMVGGSDYRRISQGKKAEGSWAIYLYPEDANSTWLIARSAGSNYPPLERALRYVAFEVPHFIMERRMLQTMKRVVERAG